MPYLQNFHRLKAVGMIRNFKIKYINICTTGLVPRLYLVRITEQITPSSFSWMTSIVLGRSHILLSVQRLGTGDCMTAVTEKTQVSTVHLVGTQIYPPPQKKTQLFNCEKQLKSSFHATSNLLQRKFLLLCIFIVC